MSRMLDAVLSHAYNLDQVQHNELGASEYLKGKFDADPALAMEAADRHRELAMVVKARRRGSQHGDHISKALHDVLGRALA